MIRNLIFDWSGTLADDLAAVLTATNGVLGHHGRAVMDREEFRRLFRLPYTEFYQDVLPGISLESVKEQYMKHFPSDHSVVPMLPFAREFLEFGVATGRRMVVMSSAPEEHVRAQAEANGVTHFFEAIWGGIIDKRIAVHELLAEMKMRPEDTAFVGDMRHDIDAGKAGGVLSVAVATGYESVALLMESVPDVVLPDLSKLSLLLGGALPVATVGALIFDSKGKVLLVRTHKWQNRWGIAGGKIRRGESAMDALHRETMEETGLEIGDVELVMVQDCIEPEEFESSAHFVLLNYTATVVGDDDIEVTLNDEAEEFCWVLMEEALNMDLNKPTRWLIEEVAQKKR
ncbi:NUDIX domain-containing protein [Phragmitibacter flavus]|uniref:NUDIX domain-containing protein n=1 Tax=Phragmitibacter flavus TaxID=2576071 RepID=A0A5R8KET8_9BACT|nr:NUDIX domain-containing protein [Phragmitibacter flavus]TLD70816.1 NUDIX domain-containing protein [Phragmitibacter flavus]